MTRQSPNKPRLNRSHPNRPRVFIDADVLFAGSATPTENGASLVILRLAEITLINGITSQQAIVEAERNLSEKLPVALPAFRLIVSRCVQVVADPLPGDLEPFRGMADPKDLPLLVSALREQCSYLITFNIRHFRPGHPGIAVLRPGDFILRVRDELARLSSGDAW